VKAPEPLPKTSTDGLVVKLSWQLEGRRSEVEFLEHLRSRGFTSVPHVVACGDLAEMKDGLHGEIQSIMGRKPRTDNRIYRAIVMKPFLLHLTTIAEWTKFYELFKRLIYVHREVYIKAKILHRDINPENLMVKADTDSTYHPYLIDFDFAKDMDEDAPKDTGEDASEAHINSHRTMSTPFLAVDLLSNPPPPALYRHDLESFIWCLWWIAVSYLNGKQILTQALQGWYNGNWVDIRNYKRGSMRAAAVEETPLTQNMKSAGPIIERLLPLFGTEYRRKSDRESAGQIITWESFEACLD